MMRSERENNPVTLSTAPMNKLKKTSMPESDPGTKRIWQGETSNHSLEEGEIPNQTTTGCSSKERNNVTLRDQTVFYSPSTFNLKPLKVKFMNLMKETDGYKISKKADADPINFWRQPIDAIYTNIEYCLENFGLWCAREVAQIHIKNCEIDITADGNTVFSNDIKMECLREAWKILNDAFPSGLKNNGNIAEGNLFGVKEGFITPKIHAFMRCLVSREYKGMSCVVTVENMLSAIAISMFMKTMGYFEYKDTYRKYSNGLKMKQKSPNTSGFKKVHILFTMNGINAQKYDYIIHFDLPKTATRSYILSCEEVGQSKPSYIVLLERGNSTQQDLFYKLIENEYIACEKCHIPSFPEVDFQKYSISDEGCRISENGDAKENEEAWFMGMDMDFDINELYQNLDLI